MALLPERGVIDADGHVIEPDYVWEEYLEERYRELAIRVREDSDGWEYLEVQGQPYPRLPRGAMSMLGTMGDPDARPSPDRKYMQSMPFGAGDAGQRIERLDREGLDAVLLYPTIGIVWECAVTDVDLSDAYARAYNRWIADFCRDSGGRLVPIAHLSLGDVELATRELERAVKDGCRGAFFLPFTLTRTPHGHPDHDRLWEVAQALGVPVVIHPGYEPAETSVVTRFDGFDGMIRGSERNSWFSNVFARQGVQQAFASMFAFGTFDRFPKLKFGVLESAAGWIGAYLDRMDAMHEIPMGRATELERFPSEYFARQCFISADPDERAAPLIMDHVGIDRFIWATDFPHPDHPADWPEKLPRFIEPLSEEGRRRVLGQNVQEIYGLA